jgi:hypothetical protein
MKLPLKSSEVHVQASLFTGTDCKTALRFAIFPSLIIWVLQMVREGMGETPAGQTTHE